MRVAFRYVNKFAFRCPALQMSEEASPRRQTHPGRSSRRALFSHELSGINLS